MTPQREALVAFWFWAFLSGAVLAYTVIEVGRGMSVYLVLIALLSIIAASICVSWWRVYVAEQRRFPR